jgi:hypothetical protein
MHDYFALIDKETNKREEINKVIHLALCMIFVAHATIAEAIKDHDKLERKKRRKLEQEEEEKGEASEGKLELALSMTLP